LELSRMVAENARQIDSQNARIYNLLGALDLADKNRNLALEDFKRAVELRPSFSEAQNNLGALLVAAQDYPEAIEHLQVAVRDSQDDPDGHLNLGNAYRGNKQYDQAKTEYERVLQLDPKQVDAYFNLGVLFFDGQPTGVAPIDRLNQAIAYFERFRSAGGQDPRLDQFVKEAQKAIGQEKRHEELEEKDRLRKQAEEQKKAQQQLAAPPPLAGGSKLGDKIGEPNPSPSPASGDKLQGGK